jgi:hypothetical protein
MCRESLLLPSTTVLFALRRGLLALLVVGLSARFADSASAAEVLYDSNGFETLNLAALEGQTPWQTAGTGGSAVVQSGVVQAGSKAVQVTKAAAALTDRRWYVPVENQPSGRFIVVDWDMRVAPTTSTAFGPFFGVETYDYLGSTFPVDKGVLGTLGLDASTGDLLIQGPGGDFADTGVDASFNAWHHYRIVLDFSDHEYHTFFNNSYLVSSNFVDGNGLNDFTDADISALAANGDPVSQNLGGTAYFDNFLVREGLLGDYTDNGIVDTADYNRWKMNFGNLVSAGTGADGNGDGVVNAADYTVWRNNLGASLNLPMGLSASGSVAVPEPGSLAILFSSLLPGLLTRRRRNKFGVA